MKPPAWAAMLTSMLILALAPGLARAAAPMAASGGASYSMWTVTGSSVHLLFTLPTSQARRLTAPGAASISAAVSAGVGVGSAGGDCTMVDRGPWVGKIYTLSPAPGLDRFEMIFDCPSANGLVLKDHVLFDRAPALVNYARIELGTDRPALQVFTANRQTIALPPAGTHLANAGIGLFVRQGALALLGRLDRLAVIAGLLLLARRWRDLGAIAGALGFGYFVSVAIGLTGLVVLDPRQADIATGLLVAVLGASALRLQAAEPSGPGRWRLAPTLGAGLIVAAVLAAAAAKGGVSLAVSAAGLVVFGLVQTWIAGAGPRFRWLVLAPAALFALVDGMGLASDLALLQPTPAQAAPLFLGYDLGAALAAVLLATLAMGVLWLLGRRLSPVRNLAADLAGAGLVGCGMFWFVSRLYT